MEQLSEYSGPRSIKLKSVLITRGGRKLYRHISGKGCVLEINDAGTTVKLFVVDAEYRAKPIAWSSESPATVDGLENYSINHGFLRDGSKSVVTAADITDEEINAHFGTVRDLNTSKQNTDIICAAGNAEKYPAAWHCRNVNIDGIGTLSLPNIQLLARIYCEALAIDAVDPTVQAYPDYSLIKLWPIDGATSSKVWSSTAHDSSYMWYVDYYGSIGSLPKTGKYAVVPVAELS